METGGMNAHLDQGRAYDWVSLRQAVDKRIQVVEHGNKDRQPERAMSESLSERYSEKDAERM